MMRSLKLLFVVVPFCAIGALSAPPAQAGWPPPPAAYVASYRPVYYNGYAHYYYQNHWFYRDGGGAWRWYDRDPDFLARERMNWERYHHGWR